MKKIIVFFVVISFTLISYGQNCSVNANVDQTICSSSTLTLTGGYSGTLSASQITTWSQISGPGAVITSPNLLATTVTGIIPGNTYKFRLSTNCGDGSLVYDDVTVFINPVTTANAGSDFSPVCPGNPAGTLAGNAPGAGETGAWSIVSGGTGLTITTASSPTSNFRLVAGASGDAVLRWTITNTTTGCSTFDDVIIPKIAPAAVTAGPDQTLSTCYNTTTTATLAGSYAGNGIGGQASQWTFISGPNTPTITTPTSNTSTLTNLIPGTYIFRWTVTGPCVSGSDDVQITVNAPVGAITTATINGSTNNNTLTFCDSRSEIVLNGNTPKPNETIAWSQTSGPTAGVTIVTPTNKTTTITGLDGVSTYGFTYTISTTTGCSSVRTVTIRYNGVQTLTITSAKPLILGCGVSTATVNFSQTGTGATQYSVLSGPVNSSFTYPTTYANAGSSSSATSSFNVSNLTVAGTYVVRVRKSAGTDSQCSTTYEDISIIVSRAPTSSNGGTDQVLACNVTSTEIIGSTPTVGTGRWSQVSGPNTATITNTLSAKTGVSGLINGNYVFRWLISNGPSCTVNQDEVNIRVASNTPTIANAGDDQNVCATTPVYLIGNSPVLNETGKWTVTPTSGVSFNNVNSPTAIVTGLTASTVYTFTWTISNACGSSADNVIITTNAILGPINANAGPDICLTSGTTSVTMAGNSPSPGTGNWTQISGNAATITTPTSNTTTITGLTNGNYKFEWAITRNACTITRDTMLVTISAPATTANAGVDQTVCGTTTTLEGNTAIVGQGTWTQVTGNAGVSISNVNSPTPTLSNLIAGVYTFRWTITNNACSSNYDDIVLYVSTPPATAYAGLDQTICGLATATMAATAVPGSGGTGYWSIEDGPNTPTITNSASPTTTITGLIAGTYTFRWNVNNGPYCSVSYDDVIITVTPTANAGADQTLCDVTSVNLAGNLSTNGTWTQVGTIPNVATITTITASTATASGLIPGAYTFRYTINTSGCISFDEVIVTISAPPAPVNAGPDQDLCNVTSFTMAATAPTIGTGTWVRTSGPNTPTISSNTNRNATLGATGTKAVPGTYLYEWRVTNGSCVISDFVIIKISNATSNAGSDQNICGNSATITGTTPTNGTGAWTQVSGPNTATIASTTNPITLLTGLTAGTYTFRWTITDGSCTTGFDDIVITVNTNPSIPNAGTDQNICGVTTINLAGNTLASGTGSWSKVSGPTCTITDIANPISTVTGISAGTYVFQWTSTLGTCTLSDQVTFIVNNAPTVANAGSDREICLYTPLNLSANTATVGTGTWTQISGNSVIISNPALPTTSLIGLNVGIYTFRWTITNGTCTSSSDDVTITVDDLPTMANAGPDINVCGTTATMAAGEITIGTGQWIKVSGPSGGNISSPLSPTTTITDLNRGTYNYRWTSTSGICVSTDEMIISKNCVPVAINDINNTLINTPVTGLVLTNDFSPEGNLLQVNTTPVLNPANGSVILNTNGTYTYYPNSGFTGEDTFTYSVCDNGTPSLCSQAKVTIEVLPIPIPGNNPPVAIDDAYKGSINTTVTGNIINNDFDVDGNLRTNNTLIYGSKPANGNLTLNKNGTFSFVPNNGFTGQVSFQYTVCDTGTPALCDVGTVTIDILKNETGNSTFAVDNSYVSATRVAITSNLKTNDFDPQGHTQTINTTPIVNPKFGNVVLNSNGTFTYTPVSKYFTSDQFVYELCDNGTPTACDRATVYINYLMKNQDVCAWRSIKNGIWTDETVWEALNCATGLWESTPVPPNNDRPIYVYDNVNILAGTPISADSLYIKPTGIISVPPTSTLTVTDQLIFGIDTNGNAGQLNSNGDCDNVVTTAAKMKVRKALDNTWDFISFPFAVSEANVYLGGKSTPAVWGDLEQSGTNVDFFAAEYDGAKRASDLTPSPVAINSEYYTSLSPHTFDAVKGYIITGGNHNGADSLDFVAASGTQLTLCGGTYTPEIYASVPGCNGGWNLVGTPYASAYNLYSASPYKTYWAAPNFSTVLSGDDYKLNSFGAFFMQATAATPVNFDVEGLTVFTHPNPAPRYSVAQIELGDATKSDKTLIRLGEDASAAYMSGEDAMKAQTTSNYISLIYTNAEGACSGLAVNTLPINTQRVDLRIRNNKAGVYSIKLSGQEKLNKIQTVTLVDTETGLKTDLTGNKSYSYEVTAAGITDRFYVLLSTNNSTGINPNGNNGIKVTIKGRRISISGLTSKAGVSMYDVVGKLMYKYNEIDSGQSFEVNVPGVYLMDISTETQQAMIKVLVQD